MRLLYYLYDKGLRFTYFIVSKFRFLLPSRIKQKGEEFIRLQEIWEENLRTSPVVVSSKKRIWIHASSLGEYQIIRPVVRLLRDSGNYNLIVTFFSATGYNALHGSQGREDAPDLILPLPLDTISNAERFIGMLRPNLAIFLVSEFWPNLLGTLEKKGIPTILYSAFLNGRNKLNPGVLFRKSMIRKFDTVITHDRNMTVRLREMNCKEVLQLPDPLFDNAISQKQTPYRDDVIERFISGCVDVLVAGSIHIDGDLKLIASLAEKYPDTKIILVPHEISERNLERIRYEMPYKTMLYSETDIYPLEDDTQCLVIDFIGALAKIYRYGSGAYVGGGFTPLLHSLVEALVYGIPVAFGPCIGRKAIAHTMVETRTGTIVKTGYEICEWWREIVSSQFNSHALYINAITLCENNRGGSAAAKAVIDNLLHI